MEWYVDTKSDTHNLQGINTCAVLCATNVAISTTTTQQFLILLHSTAMGGESAVEKCRLHIHDGDKAPPKGDCSIEVTHTI